MPWPNTPVWGHGAWGHGAHDNSGGGRISAGTVRYPRTVDWVDILIIGLMLLAAVHGLRLGALVQILTFGGFWLGFLLGDAGLGAAAPHRPRRADPLRRHRGPGLGTASGLGYVGRVARHVLQHHAAPAPPGQRRRRPRASGWPWWPCCSPSWLVAAVDLVAQQPLHLARRRREPLGHPALHRQDPPPGPLDLRRPADLPQRPGVPPGLLDSLTPPSTPNVVDADERADEGAGRPRRLLDGQGPRHGLQQRAGGLGLRGRQGPRGHQRARGRRREHRQHTDPRRATTRTARRRCSSTPPSTWPSCAPARRSGRRSTIRPERRDRGAPRPPSSAIPRTGRSPSTRPA